MLAMCLSVPGICAHSNVTEEGTTWQTCVKHAGHEEGRTERKEERAREVRERGGERERERERGKAEERDRGGGWMHLQELICWDRGWGQYDRCMQEKVRAQG